MKCRIVVAYTARHIGTEATAQARLSLEQQRQKLLAEIRSFNNDAKKFLPPVVFTGAHLDNSGAELGEEWDALEGFSTTDTITDNCYKQTILHSAILLT